MRETVEKPEVPKSLGFLYDTKFGSLILRMITRRWISKLAGAFMNSRMSKLHIKKYIKKHGIDMNNYVEEKYKNFNAFFTRRIRPELRPFDLDPDAFVCPCDGLLSAYRITPDLTFNVKGFDYSVGTLLTDDEAAKRYEGGLCLVFRLTVSDYHRYFFSDGGVVVENRFIKGRLHTVQPVALEKRRVFTENCREITVLDTDNFGRLTQVEVGAMMIGRIVNDVKQGRFERGEEKGRFEFGGSTVIVLVEKDRVDIDAELFENTESDKETRVMCGEKIGVKTTTDGEPAAAADPDVDTELSQSAAV